MDDSGNFFLTEIHHGLDAINLETMATLKPDGSFDLHTPHKGAAKLVSHSYLMTEASHHTPNQVHASFRSLWNAVRDHSQVRFPLCSQELVHLPARHRRLSPLGSSNTVNHALTYFNHVKLPPAALLTTAHRAKDPRAEFFHNLSRVVVGTLSMAAVYLPALRIISYVGGKYSLRRNVTDTSTGLSRPIIAFSTQYIPVMTAMADAFVSIAFVRSIHLAIRDPWLGPGMKHFLAAILKVTIFGHAMRDAIAIGDRCGAQGLLQVNQLNAFLVCIELSPVR